MKEKPRHVTSEEGARILDGQWPGVTVVDEKEAEQADMVITMRASPIAIEGQHLFKVKYHIEQCSMCRQDIIVSDSSPVLPKKVCIQCAVERGLMGEEK